MDFLPQSLSDYVEAHTQSESELLSYVNRDTHANILMPRMLSGHLQGRVLSMFCAMIKPKNILEIGTYTGYSALSMSEHLGLDGKITTIDINEELEERVRGYFKKSGKEKQINYLIGNALEIIPTLKGTFDLVFIDADKINYPNYFDLVIDKVPSGGFIIADNVLWSGKVAEPRNGKKDKDLDAILEFNAKAHRDLRVFNVLFPVRDGLMVLQKL
jgi:caffeoyl-CoA O-methyltransferase